MSHLKSLHLSDVLLRTFPYKQSVDRTPPGGTLRCLHHTFSASAVPLERPANVVARTLSATEAIVVWLSGTQPGIEGYQVLTFHDDDNDWLLLLLLLLP